VHLGNQQALLTALRSDAFWFDLRMCRNSEQMPQTTRLVGAFDRSGFEQTSDPNWACAGLLGFRPS